MIRRRGRLFAAGSALALAFLAESGGCGNEPTPQPSRSLSPVVQALADLPIPPPPPGLPTSNGRKSELEVVFAIEVYDSAFKFRLKKLVGVQAVAWAGNGQLVTVTDPESGHTNPWTDLREMYTHGADKPGPRLYIHKLAPGIVGVQVTVVYPLGRVGEFLRCYVIVHGKRIDSSTTDVLAQVKPVPGSKGEMGALTVVNCIYLDSSRG